MTTCPDCGTGEIRPADRCDNCGLSYEALLDAAAFLDERVVAVREDGSYRVEPDEEPADWRERRRV